MGQPPAPPSFGIASLLLLLLSGDRVADGFSWSSYHSQRRLSALSSSKSFSSSFTVLSRRRQTRRRLAQNDDDKNEPTQPSSASVRFSSSASSSSSSPASKGTAIAATSTLDSILTWIISDVGSIVLGCAGLVLLLIGRVILSDDTTTTSSSGSSMAAANVDALGEETRFNLLAALACCAVLVNGLSKLDVTTALAETVDLVGRRVADPIVVVAAAAAMDDDDENEDSGSQPLSWLLQATVTATPAETAVLLQETTTTTTTTEVDYTSRSSGNWKVMGYVGIVPFPQNDDGGFIITGDTPIVDRFQGQGKSSSRTRQQQQREECYLPTLQALPGRSEFASYLPSNTQAVLLLPLLSSNNNNDDDNTSNEQQPQWVLALGANQARSFTPRDIAWCQAVTQRVGEQLF